MRPTIRLFSFSLTFGVLYGMIYTLPYWFSLLFPNYEMAINYIMPIIYLPFEALIFLAFYKVGKKHDLQKSVRETSVSVFSGSAVGVSLATIIIYSIYFMIKPVPHEMLPYYIFTYVFSIIISIIYMFFTAFAGLAMGYFRDRGK